MIVSTAAKVTTRKQKDVHVHLPDNKQWYNVQQGMVWWSSGLRIDMTRNSTTDLAGVSSTGQLFEMMGIQEIQEKGGGKTTKLTIQLRAACSEPRLG